MSSSQDLKEALSQRLKRMDTGQIQSPVGSSLRSSLSRMGSFSPSSGSLLSHNDTGKLAGMMRMSTMQVDGKSGSRPSLGLPVTTPLGVNGLTRSSTSVLMPVNPTVSVAPSIECEGYLSKYSSGSVTGRWQRRYFVLHGSRFGYYKKQPKSKDVKPDKTFALRRIKSVFNATEPCGPNEREFSMQLGDDTYLLKAGTPAEMRKWMSALSTALAHRESFVNEADEDDENAGESNSDMNSEINSVSSAQSDASVMSEDVQAYLSKQRAQAVGGQHQETVWEIDVDPDQLDVLFSNLFPSANDQVRMTIREINEKIHDGLLRVISHLYATLSNEVFDPDVVDIRGQFHRVEACVFAVRKFNRSKSTDPVRSQLSCVLMEYIPRMVQIVDKFLEKRAARRGGAEEEDDGSSVTDLPGLINVLANFMNQLAIVWMEEEACCCVYCDAAGTTNSPQDGGVCKINDKWRKCLKSCQQRVCSEFEVCLIEKIQSQMLPIDTTWDAAVGSVSGPAKVSHALFGNRSGIWLTAWASSLIVSCQTRGVDLLKNENLCTCTRLISELLASVLVAVLNSAWRQFKRKSTRTNEYVLERKRKLVEASNLMYANSGFWGVFVAGQTSAQISQILRIPELENNTLELSNLLAFANEAVLISLFLTESLPEQLPFIPKIFSACFEQLGITFINSAIETCTHIVYFHFTDRGYSDTEKAFKQMTQKTPMVVCRDLVDKFVGELIPFGAHPSVKGHCISALPFAVIHLYISGIMKEKPKICVVKNLVEIFQTDLVVFKALFSEQRLGATEFASTAMSPMHWILSFITEKDIRILIDDLAPKFAVFFANNHSIVAINILIDMRGSDLSKIDKATIIARATAKIPFKESPNDPDNLPWRFN